MWLSLPPGVTGQRCCWEFTALLQHDQSAAGTPEDSEKLLPFLQPPGSLEGPGAQARVEGSQGGWDSEPLLSKRSCNLTFNCDANSSRELPRHVESQALR